MNSDWTPTRCADFIEFNPRLSLKKGTVATKISMDKLRPFTKKIWENERAAFSGGAKFANGDTIMARITPCLENGKTAFVDCLAEGEIAFGSTEFIVLRAKREISDARFLYYLATGSEFRDVAIKSMVGTSGRQRVQQSVLEEWTTPLPPLETQRKIAAVLSALDDKIELNRRINANLEQQAFAVLADLLENARSGECRLAEIVEFGPKCALRKNEVARCVEMKQLSTVGSFPLGWETAPYRGGTRFANGDTLLARITPCLENGKAAYVNFLEEGETAFGSTEYIVMRSRGVYPAEFFYCLARNSTFVDYAIKNLNGTSGRQRVSSETLGEFALPRLTAEEIAIFRNAVVSSFEKIRNNGLENIALVAVRDALLPRLMSGEIDVSNVAL